MPITTLKFKDNEQEELRLALAGPKFYGALWDIKNHIRSLLKHTDVNEETEKILEGIRNMIPPLDEE